MYAGPVSVQVLSHGRIVTEHFTAAFMWTSWNNIEVITPLINNLCLSLTDTSYFRFICVWFLLHFEFIDGFCEFGELLWVREIDTGDWEWRILYDSFAIHILRVVGVDFRIRAVLVVRLGGSPHCHTELALHRLNLYLSLFPPARLGLVRLNDVDVVQFDVLCGLWNNR